MRQCPYCGSELPDDENVFYCLKCDHIIDENVLLRMEIKKELEKPKSKKGKGKYKRPARQPVVQNKKSKKDTYIPHIHYEEKKSYGNLILIFIVVLLIIYMLYK